MRLTPAGTGSGRYTKSGTPTSNRPLTVRVRGAFAHPHIRSSERHPPLQDDGIDTAPTAPVQHRAGDGRTYFSEYRRPWLPDRIDENRERRAGWGTITGFRAADRVAYGPLLTCQAFILRSDAPVHRRRPWRCR